MPTPATTAEPVPPAPSPPPQRKPGLSPEQVAKVKTRLAERGVSGPCPRCGQVEFSVISQGLLKPQLMDLPENVLIGLALVPSILTICVQCGFLSLHALGTLGFLKDGKVDIE
jgi:hypothetical protein